MKYSDIYKYKNGGEPKVKRDATVGISGLSPFIAYNPGKDPYGQYKGEVERANYINNINSRGYKSRLQRELFGDVQGPITDVENQMLNREVERRAENINTVDIDIEEAPLPGADAQYDWRKHKITTPTKPEYIYHELAHASNEAQPGEGFKKKYLEILKANGFEGDNVRGLDYFKRPTEVQARLNSLRLKAIEDGTYNNDEDFNIEKNDSYPERGYQELKNETGLSDAQIEELMKSSAYTPSKNNNQYQSAKNGGIVKYLKDNYYNKLK